jgi:hypothetical protein
MKVVLSTATYPNAWISPVFISSHPYESVSPVIQVRLKNENKKPSPASETEASETADMPAAGITISRVGDNDIEFGRVISVGASTDVIVEMSQKIPSGDTVYVCAHPVSHPLWSCYKAIDTGDTYVAPDISLAGSHLRDGTLFQLIALNTRGELPVLSADYPDITLYALSVSEVVTVRYEPERSLSQWILSKLPFDEDDTFAVVPIIGRTESIMWLHWLLFALIVFLILFLLFGLYRSEQRRGAISTAARKIADTIDKARESVQKWHGPSPTIHLARFILGVTILVLILYAITHYYITLYTAAITKVLQVRSQEATGLAVWLILLTALVGIFADLADRMRRGDQTGGMPHRPGLFRVLFAILIFVAAFLWFFEGVLYGVYLYRPDQGAMATLVASFGGGAFALIAIIETAAFFFVTELTLEPIGPFAVLLCWLLLSLMSGLFRLIQHICESWSTGGPPAPPGASSSESDLQLGQFDKGLGK